MGYTEAESGREEPPDLSYQIRLLSFCILRNPSGRHPEVGHAAIIGAKQLAGRRIYNRVST
jgi:hypothetical protein